MKLKRLSLLLLAIVMLLSVLPMSVFAQTGDLIREGRPGGSPEMEAIGLYPELEVIDLYRSAFMEHVGHGEFRMIERPSRAEMEANLISNAAVTSAQIGDVVAVAPVTDELLEGFYQVGRDTYLVQMTDTVYLLMEKIEVDTENLQNNAAAFAMRDICEERIEELESLIQEQRDLGNEDFSIELYYPAFLDTGGFSPLWNVERTSAIWHYTCRYGRRWELWDVIWAIRGGYPDLISIARGANTRAAAQAFTSMGANSVGMLHPTLSMFGFVGGIIQSAFDLYVASGGRRTFTVHHEDWARYTFRYDRIIKDTRVRRSDLNHGFRTGSLTGRVWVDYVYVMQYYRHGGGILRNRRTINRVFESPHLNRRHELAIEGFNLFLRGVTTNPIQDHSVYVTLHGNRHRFEKRFI